MNSSRILLITRNLPPLVGGMERLNWHMADELSKCAHVRVVGPKGAAALKPGNVEIREAPLKPLPLFLSIAFLKALWLALRWKPDVVVAGSGLTAPLAWLISRCCNTTRSVVYLHGFDITVRNRLYQRLWTPVFGKMDGIIVNSSPTRLLALAAGVPEAKISIIYPGVSLPEAPQSAENIAAFKRRHDLENKKILLSVGRLTTRKGLCEFVEHALPGIVAAEPNTALIVIGEAPKNSLGAGIQSVESIQEQAKKSGVAEHVHFLGVITDKARLAAAYEAADIHVFPVRYIPDDPEGFGMVAIEAAAHGLPTVAFATGGVVDAVQHGVSGYLAKENDYAEFCSHVIELLRQPLAEDKAKDFAQTFEWGSFGDKVTDYLKMAALVDSKTTHVRQAHAATDLSSRIQ